MNDRSADLADLEIDPDDFSSNRFQRPGLRGAVGRAVDHDDDVDREQGLLRQSEHGATGQVTALVRRDHHRVTTDSSADGSRGDLCYLDSVEAQSGLRPLGLTVMPPAVTVLIPMYQAERTIRACLTSVLDQSLRDLEVVVVDDGSTDRGPEIVGAVGAVDDRVRLVRNASNLGVAEALNVGLDASASPLVARLDADDEALPGRLEAQRDLFDTQPDLGVCGSFVEYAGVRGRRLLGTVPVSHQEIAQQLRETTSSPFFHPAVMFRRQLVVGAGGYRPRFGNAEDYDLWLRLLGQCSFHNLPHPFTRYRLSLSGASLGPVREQWLYAILAKTSWERPQERLEDLWDEIRTGVGEAELAAAERRARLRFARLLADSGQRWEAARYLHTSRTSVGRLAVARFFAGRLRRRLRDSTASAPVRTTS